MTKLTDPTLANLCICFHGYALKYDEREASANSLYTRHDVQFPKDKICVVSTQIYKQGEKKRERGEDYDVIYDSQILNKNFVYSIRLTTYVRTYVHRLRITIKVDSSVSQPPFYRVLRIFPL